jgi:hypothetical protein
MTEFALGLLVAAMATGFLVGGWRRGSFNVLPGAYRARWKTDPVNVIVAVAASLVGLALGCFLMFSFWS